MHPKLKFLSRSIAGFFKRSRSPQLATSAVNKKPRHSPIPEAERLDRLRNPSKYLGTDSKQLPGPPGPENRTS